MKINKKVKDKVKDLLFEFRLGTEDMEPQQHIRYSMFNTPGPDIPGNPDDIEEETEEEIDVIKPSEISPIQLHSVVQNIDKVPDNVIELKNILNPETYIGLAVEQAQLIIQDIENKRTK